MTMQREALKATRKPIQKVCVWGDRIDRLVPNSTAFCQRHGISLNSYNGIRSKPELYIQSTPWPAFDAIRRGLEEDLQRPILWEQLLFDPQIGLVDMGHLSEWQDRWIFKYPQRPEGLDLLRERVLWLLGYRGWAVRDVVGYGYHTSSWMSKMLKGKILSPSMCAMQDLCLVLGCTYDWLLGDLKHEHPKWHREASKRKEEPRKERN